MARVADRTLLPGLLGPWGCPGLTDPMAALAGSMQTQPCPRGLVLSDTALFSRWAQDAQFFCPSGAPEQARELLSLCLLTQGNTKRLTGLPTGLLLRGLGIHSTMSARALSTSLSRPVKWL